MEANNSSSRISAAAYAYQVAMSISNVTAETTDTQTNPSQAEAVKDTTINNHAVESSVPGPGGNTSAPSSLPARTSTPVQTTAPGENSSRAASQHPETGLPTMPTYAPPHGAPARQYLNSKVTATLLEGMKLLAKEQPRDPLRVLGEFLLQKSKEIEGS